MPPELQDLKVQLVLRVSLEQLVLKASKEAPELRARQVRKGQLAPPALKANRDRLG